MSDRLTVLHVDTERGWRGGERQALWLAMELQRQGHRSLVVARPREPLAFRSAEAGLEVVPLSPRFEADPLAVWSLRRTIGREHVDVVHAHSSHAAGIAALAVLRTRARLVVTRRVDFELSRNPASRWKYRRADGLIAISGAVADVMARSGLARARMDVVPDGIDLRRHVEKASSATLAELGIESGRPLVVMVAALVPHKDPLNFVRAIAHARRRVPDIQALLVGGGMLAADVSEAIVRHGLEATLRATGHRDDADALIAAASVFALSSHLEGMGSVLLDALSLGIPVAATRAGGIPEIIEDGRSGILADIRDPRQLGDAIARLLGDADLAREIAAAGRIRAAEFSMERTAERTLAVYRRVLDRPVVG